MPATEIPVPLPQQPYKILIQEQGIAEIGQHLRNSHLLRKTLGQKILVVSNPQIWKHYGDRLQGSLEAAGYEVLSCILPAGERYKTLKTIQKIYDCALAHRLERSSTLLALGGGVIGDMTGFAAATWLRGISVVQVPTSLLAMVDAAIGGKTGVNHPQGKNLIGAFHQPMLVLIDPETLQTLPGREFRAAMAEVIKYGVIWDEQLFQALEASPRLDQLRYVPPSLLSDLLKRSCAAKAKVVTQDEKEAGLRAILNYGHTLGHTIESMTRYRLFNHGEAVGLGMIAAGRIAVALQMWSQDCCDRQHRLIQKCGLPTQLPQDFDSQRVLSLLRSDKKVKDGAVRFVLPRAIGQVTLIDQVPDEVVLSVVEALKSPHA
ncbi:3-dehydroquinate synthase [Lyngbya confervoides]|uniref:3-dehydroquinate synthase n=1 Tax=Lyngbya confervoides BDU141951 TaxID=1574623 RepID=A0ABD4T6Q3_9CYAN|nr:3-dehydroquinate synthase [Lyngbya confervoides]MCM1984124.1 3-dehydroquinate synthase [Lyngbya confervoides BDU141951]